MRKIKHFYWKLAPIIGIGYWKDLYHIEEHGIDGEGHNLIILFIRIQWGFLVVKNKL